MPRRPNDTAPTPRVDLPMVALARQHPEAAIREHVRSGRWERVARGVYLPTPPSPGPSRSRAAALARVVGVHDRLDAAHWFSHTSAALLWGLPVWATPTTTHLYRAHRASADNDRRVTSHTGVPPAAELTVIGSLPVTTRFMREKRRHDAMVEEGWRAVRVTQEDLSGSALARRLLPLLPPEARVTLAPRRALFG